MADPTPSRPVHAETEPADWTRGPAKWGAVAVLGAASITGLAWSISTRGPAGLPAVSPGAAPRSEGVPAPAAPSTRGAPDAATPTPDAAGARPSPARTVNLNTASAAELELLPGIGPGLAARILDDRRTRGPFKSVDDLDRVRGIGPRTIEKLRGMASVE